MGYDDSAVSHPKADADNKPPPELVSLRAVNDKDHVQSVSDINEGHLDGSSSVLARLRHFEAWVNKKTKFEPRGVERLPEEDRRAPKKIFMLLMWFSVILNPEYLSVGTLGPILGVSVRDSIICVLMATIFGSLFPAFTGTLSPPTGLRQIAMSRYSFGLWGAKLCTVINIISSIGWAVISAILAGQILTAVSDGALNIIIGIVVVNIAAFIITFLGLPVLQYWSSAAWIVIFIVMCVQFGQTSPYFPDDLNYSPLSGIDYAGAGLTFFAITLGTSAPWCTVVGDYLVEYPSNINKWLVFCLTWLGIALPTIFVNVLGAMIGGVIQTDAAIGDQYYSRGIGAVILTTMHPKAWGISVGVIYFISFFTKLCLPIYSGALNMQLLDDRFQQIPRFVWVLLNTATCMAISMGGREHLQDILINFLSILGYWAIAFGLVLGLEHFVFRPRLGGYDVEVWQKRERLPLGIAATGALAGSFALAFLGMNQTWYIGPVAKTVGVYGGDVGNYIVIVAVLIIYLPVRACEISFWRRA